MDSKQYKLEKYQGSTKKGKIFTAYRVVIGKYRSPLFFPSDIELMYIDSILNEHNKSCDVVDEIGDQLSYEN